MTLPMTGLTPATPVGYAAPPSTGPAFGTFVVLSASLGPPPPPTASFTYSPATPTANTPVTFTDTSTGNPTSWQWIFGDGGTSTQRNPTQYVCRIGDLYDHFDRSEFGGIEPDVRSLRVTLRSIPPTPSGFYTLSPCRVIDTRNADGPRRGSCSGCQFRADLPGGRVVRRSGRREDGIGESHRHERGGAGRSSRVSDRHRHTGDVDDQLPGRQIRVATTRCRHLPRTAPGRSA